MFIFRSVIVIVFVQSRSKVDDPDHIAIKARAKEMQRLEMEEIRQREANETALQAIGFPKKRLKTGNASSSASGSGGLGGSSAISANSGLGGLGASASGSASGGSNPFGSYTSKPVSEFVWALPFT